MKIFAITLLLGMTLLTCGRSRAPETVPGRLFDGGFSLFETETEEEEEFADYYDDEDDDDDDAE